MSELSFNAYEVATIAHLGQKYGDEPYIHHPVRVANRMEKDDEVGISVAYLHKALKMMED